MKIPSIPEAEKLLNEAERLNPGSWADHSRVAARCAKTIAENCADSNIDATAAYSLGLLHDIGRRFGVGVLRHVFDGYNYMLEMGCSDSAQICLTHSFPIRELSSFSGQNDLTPEESIFLKHELEKAVYSDYDKLIQLCDAIAYPAGPCIIEKRLLDVYIRHGINDYTERKYKAFLDLRAYFEEKTGCILYSLFSDLIL